MTERDKVIQDIDDTMRTYLEIARLHNLNFMATYDIGNQEFQSIRHMDSGATIDFVARLVLDMSSGAQDYFMGFVAGEIKAQRGIVDKPKRKFSILWGLVSFG
jgi:hypothetical protein